MTGRQFSATLEKPDPIGGWTFLHVPVDEEEIFCTGARVAVKGSVNGAAFRSSLLPQGDGNHILVVTSPSGFRPTPMQAIPCR